MASSLLLSLLDVSEEEFHRLPEATRAVLLAVLYDAWSRDPLVEAAWLEALQSAHPAEAFREIRAALRQPLMQAAHELHVGHPRPRE